MARNLRNAYIPACTDCLQNKGPTTKPAGPLHSLPVPDARGSLVAINFIRPLPEENGYNTIVTMTDHIGSNIQIVPTRTDITAEDFAALFFNEWYCENELPDDIVSEVSQVTSTNAYRSADPDFHIEPFIDDGTLRTSLGTARNVPLSFSPASTVPTAF